MTATSAGRSAAEPLPAAEIELGARLAEVFRSEPATSWLERLKKANIPAIEAVLDYASAFADDALLVDQGIVIGYEHPTYGQVRQPALLAPLGPTPQSARWPAPLMVSTPEKFWRKPGTAPTQSPL